MGIVNHANVPDLHEQLKPHDDGGNTAQGFYVVGADGKFYGWMNCHDTTAVSNFIEKGLSSFVSDPPSPVQISQAALTERFSITPDPATTVIRVFTRIRPVPKRSNVLNSSVGRDRFWILQDEVKQIVAPSHDNGLPFALPAAIVTRLVRYHLVDNVRGEPEMWTESEVKRADFSAKLVANDGSSKSYEFHGDFALKTANGRRGVKGDMNGRFDISHGVANISRFRAFGEATAWGASKFTQGAPPGRFHLVIAMIETDDPLSKIVPPQGMNEWSDYLHPQKNFLENIVDAVKKIKLW